MKNLFILVILLFVFTNCKKDQTEIPKKAIVTTIAGSTNRGYANGDALSAQFDNPADLVIASDGSIYVADRSNFRIRKIAGGQVSTFAGNSNSDVIDSTGEKAAFATPHCITSDVNGNLFVLDANDPRVRKITTAALVSTYSGMATEGYVDGAAAQAKFRYSNGIACDAQGNVYVADAGNHCIRKISTTGQVTTLAGSGLPGYIDGTGANAQFNAPYGIACDKSGNIFVLDVLNYRIRKITPSGKVTTFTGSGQNGEADGNSSTVEFSFLQDIVSDDKGNFYITDDARIRKISANGTVTTVAGGSFGYKDGEGTEAKFASPKGLAIDADGNLLVADEMNHRIRKISFE